MSMYNGVERVVPLVLSTESRTKQSMKDECDVNLIVSRFQRDGVLTHMRKHGSPQYLDVSEVQDYRTAIETVRAGEEFFMTLPAKVRERFSNDPAEFVDAVSTEEGRKAFEELREELYGDRRVRRKRRAEDKAPAAPEPSPEAGEGS